MFRKIGVLEGTPLVVLEWKLDTVLPSFDISRCDVEAETWSRSELAAVAEWDGGTLFLVLLSKAETRGECYNWY